MTIDTEVHQITKPGVNLSLELGFDKTEAAHLQAESQQRISPVVRACLFMPDISMIQYDDEFRFCLPPCSSGHL